MFRHIVIIKLLVLCSLLLPVNAYADNHAYHVPYAGLLKDYVKQGSKRGVNAALVDYVRWGKDERHTQAMEALMAIDPAALKGHKKMAFWINAYNLLTIDLIVKTDERESIRNQGSLLKNVWKKHRWDISGKSYTLDGIEHKILRPMGDARIHVAINCASLSCPDLLGEPYKASMLDAQLDKQSKRFVKDATKGVRASGGELQVSKIFDWFEEDFGDKDGAAKWVQTYLGADVATPIDDYLDYNWSLNSQ